MKWGHDQLANDLAEHLAKQTDRIIWTDMQLGPSGSPRPDVYSIPKSYSGYKPIAYECKVSVSDFRSDITKGKWQSYLKYSSGVIFAVPKGLITKDDLPKGCGLIVRSENGWRMVKGPTLTPIANNLPADYWIKLVIDGVNRSVTSKRYEQGFEYRAQREITQKYGEEVGQALRSRDDAIRKLDYRTKEIHEQLGAIDIIRHAQRQKDSIESEKQDLERLHNDLCALLNLPAGSNRWDLSNALDTQKRMLSKDSHVAKCQTVIQRALRNMKDQVETLQQLSDMTEVDEGNL